MRLPAPPTYRGSRRSKCLSPWDSFLVGQAGSLGADTDRVDTVVQTERIVCCSYTNVLLSVPTCSTHTRTTSPDLRNSLLARPTPAGVPVRITSPGWSVRRVESWAICSAREKIILLV